MQLNLGLGTEMKDVCCPSDSPVGAKTDSPKKYYPSFHYSGDKKLKIPAEGEMVVRYKKTSSEHRTDSDNKEHYACTIEIREIVSVESEDAEAPASNLSRDTEDALDSIARKQSKAKDDY